MKGVSVSLDVLYNYSEYGSIAKIVAIIFMVLLLSFLINLLLSHSILGMSYRIFVAPGVILHELAHAFLCLITGASITKMAFFEKTGGHVEHKPSKIPILGSLMISLAPFVIGLFVIYLLSKKLGLKEIDLSETGLSLNGLINYYKNTFFSLNWGDLTNLAIVYLVLSIAVTMTPSAQDIRNTLGSVALIILAIGAVIRFTDFNFTAISIPNQAFVLLSTVLFLLIFSLVLSIVIYVLSKLVKPV